MGSKRHSEFEGFIADYWRRLFNFSYRMTLDRERAAQTVEETFLRAFIAKDNPPEAHAMEHWLLRIANHVLEQKLPRTPELNFDVLDDTLRSEATRTDVVRSLTDPQRDFMLWEMKQGCMTAVINCLSPGERAAFVFSAIIKIKDDDAAVTLGITKSAYKVRLSRARKKVSDYLAPRCEHVDPMNPCRCPARVGVALSKGFIRSSGEFNLRKPPAAYGRYGSGPNAKDKPLRDVVAIFGHLPDPDPPEELPTRLLSQLQSGAWDKVRKRSK